MDNLTLLEKVGTIKPNLDYYYDKICPRSPL